MKKSLLVSLFFILLTAVEAWALCETMNIAGLTVVQTVKGPITCASGYRCKREGTTAGCRGTRCQTVNWNGESCACLCR